MWNQTPPSPSQSVTVMPSTRWYQSAISVIAPVRKLTWPSLRGAPIDPRRRPAGRATVNGRAAAMRQDQHPVALGVGHAQAAVDLLERYAERLEVPARVGRAPLLVGDVRLAR